MQMTGYNAAMSARRTAGSEGCGGGPGAAGFGFFPRLRGLQKAVVLEVGEGHHGQQRVMVQPQPGAALEVIETELVLELLMCLLDIPSLMPL